MTDEGTAENAEHAEEIAGRGRTGSRLSDLTIVSGGAAPLLTERITTGMDLIRRAANEIMPVVDDGTF